MHRCVCLEPLRFSFFFETRFLGAWIGDMVSVIIPVNRITSSAAAERVFSVIN
jgi:hypothetical protein